MLAVAASYWRLFDPDGDVHAFPGSSFWLVLGAVGFAVYTVVMPLWFGVVVLLGIGVLAFDRWLPAPRIDGDFPIGRAAISATIVAAAALTTTALGPQRFDRVETPLLGGRLDLAYVGEKGDDLIVAACHRDRDGFSEDPIVLRVDREALGPFVLVRSGYTFYDGADASLLSVVAATVGVSVWRPPSVPRVLEEQFGTSGRVENVCGVHNAAIPAIRSALLVAASG